MAVNVNNAVALLASWYPNGIASEVFDAEQELAEQLKTVINQIRNGGKNKNKSPSRGLPNEVLVDVLRWCDRRTLENRIRLVGRRLNAIVQCHFVEHPRMIVDNLAIVFIKKAVLLDVTFRRNGQRPATSLNFIRRPMDTFQVDQIPPYIACSFIRITLHESLFKEMPNMLTVGKLVDRVSNGINRQMFGYTFNIPLPRNKTMLECTRAILSRVWSSSSAVHLIDVKGLQITDIFNTALIQNSDFLTVEPIESKDVPSLMNWLLESNKTARHARVFLSSVPFDVLFRPLLKQFKKDTTPHNYHIMVFVDADQFPRIVQYDGVAWKNPSTCEAVTVDCMFSLMPMLPSCLDVRRQSVAEVKNPCVDCSFKKCEHVIDDEI